MLFSMPIQWYHSHVDPIWPDGTAFWRGFCFAQGTDLRILKIFTVAIRCTEGGKAKKYQQKRVLFKLFIAYVPRKLLFWLHSRE